MLLLASAIHNKLSLLKADYDQVEAELDSLFKRLESTINEKFAEVQSDLRNAHKQQSKQIDRIEADLAQIRNNPSDLLLKRVASSVELRLSEIKADLKEYRQSNVIHSVAATQPDSVLKAAAPAFFPIDPETGRISFPKEVQTILIDVGAREPSHFLNIVSRGSDECPHVLDACCHFLSLTIQFRLLCLLVYAR